MTDRKYYKWSPEDLQNAINDHRNEGIGLNKCARLHKVPKATLKRHLDKGDTSECIEIKKGRPTVFSYEFEDILVNHILMLEQNMFGLTISDVRRLAFEIVETNNITHTFNRTKKMSGKAWYYGFLKRHKDKISLRQPEATSLNRAKGFNRENLNHFFDIYESIVDSNKLTANKIFNADESGFQTVQKKPQKIVGGKGKKQVGALTSGERGVNTTMVACASASGQMIPPMLIFKRMRMNEQLREGAPVGSIVTVSESGYINCELFNHWLQHFTSFVKPTKEDKVLLLLDGHTTHSKNLDALILARDNGVILLQLPGHTTHRLQPLDVSFFKPMSTYYTQAIESWMRTNVGRAVTQYQVSQLINTAYERAATIGNVVNGFKASGIWPVNRHVFKDCDFAPAESLMPINIETSMPMSSNVSFQSQPFVQSKNKESQIATQSSTEVLPSTSKNIMQSDLQKPSTYTASDEKQKLEASLNVLSPIPKSRQLAKGRGAQKAVELTSSPYKNNLETSQQKRQAIRLNLDKKTNKQQTKTSNKTTQMNKKHTSKKSSKTRKQKKIKVNGSDSEESDEEEEVIVFDDSDSSIEAEDKENECAKCKRNYYDKKGPKVDWVQCVRCHNWNHESCTQNPDICDDCSM